MSWIITGTTKISWTPAEITTKLWLDAADATTFYDAILGGSNVSPDGLVARWEDKSGNDRHMTQSDSAKQPIYKANAQNGNSVLRFDGSNDAMESTGFTSWMNATLFFTSCKTTTADSLFSLFGNNTRSAFYYIAQKNNSTEQDNNGARIDGAEATWTTRGGYWDAVARDESFVAMLPVLSFSGVSVLDNLDIPSGSFLLPMDYNEIIVLDDTADTATIEKIEGYLAHKWGTTGLLPAEHPYKISIPVP